MIRYLIDTPLLAAGLFNRPVALELLRPWIVGREAATSILSYGEVVEYIQPLPDFAGRHSQLRDLLQRIRPYFLTYSVLRRYAALRLQLRPPQGPGLIGDIDTLIAATAIERDLTIVTTDRDFERVPGLKVQMVQRNTLSR